MCLNISSKVPAIDLKFWPNWQKIQVLKKNVNCFYLKQLDLRPVLVLEIVVATGPKLNFFTFKIIKEVYLIQLCRKGKPNQKPIIYWKWNEKRGIGVKVVHVHTFI